MIDILPGGNYAYSGGPFQLVSVTDATVGSHITGAGVNAGKVGLISDSNGDGINDTVTFSFGDVTNTFDNSATIDDTISFDITARVLDTPANYAGETEYNRATVQVTAPDGTVRNTDNAAAVEIVEPHLVISKTSSVSTVDADDTYTYTVTLTNQNSDYGAPAYDVSIDDLLNQLAPNAVFLPGTVVIAAAPAGAHAAIVTGNAGADSTVKVTADRLLEGQSITLTFQARATGGAISGQTIHNDATADATSEPGTPPSDRPYHVTDPNDVVIASPTITKSVFATSFGDTGSSQFNGGRPDVKVDEIVTYRMVVTVPEGQSINFRVIDTLADQLVSGSSGLLQYIVGSARVVSAGANLSSTSGILTPTVSPTDANGNGTTETITYGFGTVTNTADNVSDAKDQIVFEIQARAQNVDANQNGDVLTNSVQAVTDFSRSNIARASVDFVQPELDIQKTTSFGTGDAADIASYTVTIRHTADSTNTAYNLAMGDLLAPGITLVAGSATTSSGTITETAGHVSLNVASLALGQAITVTYQARLANTVVDGQTIRNTATLDYQTDPTPGRVLHDSDFEDIHVAIRDGIIKDLISTDNSYTPGSNVVAGETVTYKLTVTLGEGAQHLIVDDVLPTGLTYVSSRVLSLGNIQGSTLAVGAAGTNSGQTLTLDFGDVINPGDNTVTTGDQVTIEVRAIVAPGTAGGLALTNTATVRPVTPANPYGVTPGTPMTPGSDTETVNTLALPRLGDKAFEDLNADGIQQTGEPGIAGVTVQLYSRDTGMLVDTRVTDGNGLYLFTNVQPGTYYEVWSLPTGYVRTVADQGADDAKDSDASATTGQTADFIMRGGQNDLTRDAGYWRPVTIGDRVFEDQNGNDVQDAGDTNVANVRVDLLDGAGNIVGTQFTDINGNYLFTGLRPGDYAVKFTPPAGYQLDNPDVGGNDATDSDANAAGVTVTRTYISGADDRTVDAGLWRPVSIGDRFTEDRNGNGVQDAGDPGIGGVTVNLLNAGGAVIGTTTTDANGNYLFTGLKPGTYSVAFVKPAGTVFSPQDQGGNDLTDSDANPATGITAPRLVTSGTTDRSVDASIYYPVKIGDRVFNDINGNGVQDAADLNMAGVTVNLLDGSNAIIGTTTTDANGNYLFTALAPGSYHVQVIKPDATWTFTNPGVGGNAALDSDTDVTTGITPVKVYVSGDDDRSIDSGMYQAVRIGDYTFTDRNGNGVQDAGDTALGGVTVQLVNTATNTVVATATTAADGSYLFVVPPGTYREIFTAPAGYIPTLQGQGGNPATDSNPDATGTTPSFSVPGGGQDLTIDAGFYIPVKIGDRVFEDQNGNGIQDAEDTNLAGVTVNLLNGAGQVVGTQVTDANGNYLFTGLRPADYQVQFVRPTGFITTAADTGTNDAIDSDASLANGRAPVKTYYSGDDDRTIDAGYYRPVTIGDHAFVDINKDGLQQALEPGLAGVIVKLIDDRTGAVVGTQTTGVTGDYLFTGYKPSEYHVEFSTPTGYSLTTPQVGTNRAIDSNPNAAGVAPSIHITSGQTDLTIDAGYQGSGKVSGNVFLDLPPGICNYKLPDAVFMGVKVELITTTGLTAAITTTDAQGNYAFDHVAPGQYIERFTNPDGTVFTQPKVTGTLAPRDSDVNADGTTDIFTVTNTSDIRMINAGLDYTGVGFQGQAPTYLPDGGGSYNFNSGAYAIGGTGSYNMMGNNGPVYFIGGSGDNNLHGSGSSGAILMGGGGNNIMEGTSGRDIIIGGCGPNNFQGLGSNNFQGLGGGNSCWPYDLLIGGVSNDLITSNSGNAIITGNLGDDALDGQGVFVGGPNNGTVSYSGTTVTGFTVGDHIKISGLSQVNYQVGDGVQWIENFNPNRGDTIEVYGYGAPIAAGLVNGQYVMVFGPNAAIVLNGYQPQNGPLTGVNYHPGQTSMPGAFGHFDALPPVILAAGQDSFTGTQGDDIAIGTNAFTTFTGNGGDDVAFGGDGGNLFVDGAGNDTYVGGRGNDIFRITEGSNQVIGCDGNNVVQFNVSRAQATITQNANGTFTVVTPAGEQILKDIQWLSFTDQNFHLPGVADAPGQVLFGTMGADNHYITSASDLVLEWTNGGIDTAWVSADNWTLSPEVEVGILVQNASILTGNGMDNRLVANAGKASFIDGGAGSDFILGSDLWGDTLLGGAGNDTINGHGGNDTLAGGSSDDLLYGEDGNDLLNGNSGHDVLVAGWGNDTIYGEDGNDVGFGEGGDDLIVLGFGNDRGYGQDGNDVLFGEGGDDILVAGWGNDVAYGQEGQDQLFGEGGDDRLFGGNGDDGLYGQLGNDFVNGEAGNDVINGGDGFDTLIGGAGSDIFFFDRPNGGTDMIMDFNRAEGDRIYVSASAFSAPAGFHLTAGLGFVSGPGAMPGAATATFYQDTNTQALWFDEDGTGPAGANVVAFLIGNPTILASDIVFV